MKSRSRLAAWMCDGSFFQYIGTAFPSAGFFAVENYETLLSSHFEWRLFCAKVGQGRDMMKREKETH